MNDKKALEKKTCDLAERVDDKEVKCLFLAISDKQKAKIGKLEDEYKRMKGRVDDRDSFIEKQKSRIGELEHRLALALSGQDERDGKIKALEAVRKRMIQTNKEVIMERNHYLQQGAERANKIKILEADVKHFKEQNDIHFGMYETWRKKAEASLTLADVKGIMLEIIAGLETAMVVNSIGYVSKVDVVDKITDFFKSKGLDISKDTRRPEEKDWDNKYDEKWNKITSKKGVKLEDVKKCSSLEWHNLPNLKNNTKCKWCEKTVGELMEEK